MEVKKLPNEVIDIILLFAGARTCRLCGNVPSWIDNDHNKMILYSSRIKKSFQKYVDAFVPRNLPDPIKQSLPPVLINRSTSFTMVWCDSCRKYTCIFKDVPR